MANPEHLAVLEEGVLAWNSWRRQHPAIRPDLRWQDFRGVDLSHADLRNANFGGISTTLGEANLHRANLSGANLNFTNLCRAQLYETNLSKATLKWAYLDEAICQSANLSEADLQHAHLFSTCLHGVHLAKANLSKAKLARTVFADIDLSTVMGLDTIEHWGPSTIGVDTIHMSGAKAFKMFLRSAGVPESVIASATASKIDMPTYYSCFLSYSHKDVVFADKLYQTLKVLRC